jgi:hypothetical protein
MFMESTKIFGLPAAAKRFKQTVLPFTPAPTCSTDVSNYKLY